MYPNLCFWSKNLNKKRSKILDLICKNILLSNMSDQKNTNHQSIGKFEDTRYEKIHNITYNSAQVASILVAEEIALLIREKQQQETFCVLGLATGSSPIKVYEELVRMHKEEGLSFYNVITFNLDEYDGIK